MNKKSISWGAARTAAIQAICTALLLTGCETGPVYHKPDVKTPENWDSQGLGTQSGLLPGEWWDLFKDPELDQLESEVQKANPTLKEAISHVDQSRAMARVAGSRLFPQLTLDPSITSLHLAADQVPPELTATAYTIPLDLEYEVDLWGRVRHSLENARAQAQATVADYAAIRLMLQADVAVNYFQLREKDRELEFQRQKVSILAVREHIMQIRYRSGLTSDLESETAQQELESGQKTLEEEERQRTDFQHAIALLCGQPSPGFQVPVAKWNPTLPLVPLALPSTLLERRPDVESAERKLAAACAREGMATADFFPSIDLVAGAGYSTFSPESLVTWQSQYFQAGPNVSLPLLNGGRLRASLKGARADYQASLSLYQKQVLKAFRDVSDALEDSHNFEKQWAAQEQKVKSACHESLLWTERWNHGLVNELDAQPAQLSEIEAQTEAIHLETLQLIAAVHLIKALGGGYQAPMESTQKIQHQIRASESTPAGMAPKIRG